MNIENLNFFTIIIFIIFVWILSYFWYQNYLKQKLINNKFKLLKTNKLFYIKNIFLWLSFFIIFLSIFWIKYWEIQNWWVNNWIDITFVLDVSKSMNVADISDSRYNYTRLDTAKKSISDFVIKHKEDRFWLIIFAWEAISTIPLTSDHDIFLTFLENVDYRNLTKQWSDFEQALSLWVERFEDSDDRSKVLIFLSDWWDTEDTINKNNISKIWKKKPWISYFVVWVWTEAWWKIINGRDPFGWINYQIYNWDYVISKLNNENLWYISSALNWEYLKIEDVWDLDKINKDLNSLEKKSLESSWNWELKDFSRSLAFISFFFFLIYIILYLFEEKIYKLIHKYE